MTFPIHSNSQLININKLKKTVIAVRPQEPGGANHQLFLQRSLEHAKICILIINYPLVEV